MRSLINHNKLYNFTVWSFASSSLYICTCKKGSKVITGYICCSASLLEYFWLYSKSSHLLKQGFFNVNDTEDCLEICTKNTFTILYLERDLCVFVRVSEVMGRHANI